MSIVIDDSSDTTVATQTSTSWHSVVSDIHINNNLSVRSHSINTWLKICFIEPDIRLTTAQEWKLRTCIRRLLSLCNLPLRISCIKTIESIPFIDHQLGLYLHILSIADVKNGLLEVKLFEFYSEKSPTRTIIHIPFLKPPRLVFHISLNILQLNLRSTNSLLELRFCTRENELVRGSYYKWNEIKNEHTRFNVTVDVDQSLINEFNTP
jgi:hypothetical protein